MGFPFVEYLDTLFNSSRLNRLLTKAEYNTLERIRRGEAGIMSLSESFLDKLGGHVVDSHGVSEGVTFNLRLERSYTAYNLRHYAERLQGLFSPRSWQSWLAEERSMSNTAIVRAENAVGINVTKRPAEKCGQGKRKVEPVSEENVRKTRYEKLEAMLDAPENHFRVNKIVDDIKRNEAEFSVTLFNKKDYVTIEVDEDFDEEDFLNVETNDDNFVETFDSYKQALSLALDNLEEIIEQREEDEDEEVVPVAPCAGKPKPAVPVAPAARLLNALRATDTDDVDNYGGFKTLSAFSYTILDGSNKSVLQIRVDEKAKLPFSLQSISPKRDYGSFASETSVLTRAWKILSDIMDDEEEFDEDEDDDEPAKKPEPKKAKRAVMDDDDDEEFPHLFSNMALARCPQLMTFSERRDELLREADGDEDDVTSLYGELRRIAEHSLVQILSSYWPNSFMFEVTDEDEEAFEYILRVEPFEFIFKHECITVIQRHRCGDITWNHRVAASQTARQRLDIAMRYFDTCSDGRVTSMLEDIGFMHNSGDGIVFRSNDTTFTVVERAGDPDLFYSVEELEAEQLSVDGEYHQLSTFLRDEVHNVRGVQFGHQGEHRYTLSLAGDCVMDLVAVASRTRHCEHIQLVADTNAATAFYAGLHEGDFDLNSLRNKGMVVTETPNIITLEFNFQQKGFLVHVYQ